MRLKLNVKSYDLELLGERGREISYGELAHLSLYLLDPFPPSATKKQIAHLVQKAVERALALYDPRFRDDFREAGRFLKRILTKALLLPEARPFFEQGVKSYREVEIQDEKGELHRLDRLVLLPEGPVILEYKLGTRRQAHWDQVRRYLRLVEGLLGPAKAYLFYLEEPILLEVGQPSPKPLF